MEKSEKVVIVGLGNVGKEYEGSRHNAGFTLVDELQKNWGTSEWKEEKSLKAFISKGEFNAKSVILVKPTTFMNLSGEAVVLVTNYYKIEPENLWVCYDDLDLPLGKIRLRKDGSAGTHNGMKSIQELYPSKNFPRLRIGIESRGVEFGVPEQMNTSDFVLRRFTEKEKPVIETGIQNGAKAINLALKEGMGAAMNQYN
ncbi:MAG: aminoacyl-tRNA hydrolase [Candidatus Peregrinibacteria bacterium]|nr:aminoacyl-tRNA hydrolase [Candidatus Peregrinibacteria bacterium]